MSILVEDWHSAETPAVADALDRLGKHGQVMNPDIKPIDDKSVLVGFARTIQFGPGKTQEDYDLLMERVVTFLESIKPGEVPVASCGLPNRYTIIGEILATAAQERGSPGWVTDGYTRDAKRIREMGYHIFCAGLSPLSFIKRARVLSVDEPIICAGAPVSPHDMIIGDQDGCVAVPQSCQSDVYEMLQEDLEADRLMRRGLRDGVALSKVLEHHH